VIADRTGELSNRFRLQVSAYERLVRNPILPGRVYERTQTQSTQAWLTEVHVRSQSITIRNMLYNSTGVVVCVSKNSRSRFPRLVFPVRFVAKRYILQQKCRKGHNKNLPACYRNTLVQLLALYTDPESHNAQRYRLTDGRQDDDNRRLYCVAVRSAKNQWKWDKKTEPSRNKTNIKQTIKS